jgi:hypothetical protein
MKKKVFLLVIFGIVLCLNITSAQARDAAALADRCMSQAQTVADRCSSSMTDSAISCVSKIEDLLAGGDYDGAVTIADRCKTSIYRKRQSCLNRLNRLLNSCWLTLNDMGETELADQVNAKRIATTGQVMADGQAAIDAINAALDGDPE